MAFVAGAALPVVATPVRRATTVMGTAPPASAPLSRRAALSAGFAAAAAAALSGVSAASAAAPTALPKLDKLSDIKKQVEAINYEDEFADIGPDPLEKEITNLKKKAKDPEYRAKIKAVIQAEESAYDEMLAKEKAEEAAIKAKFSKK